MTKISVEGYEPRHLSHSTVSSLRMCGKKFELQKVKRLEEKPGLAALGGNAVHSATEAYDLEDFFSSLDLDINDSSCEDRDMNNDPTNEGENR